MQTDEDKKLQMMVIRSLVKAKSELRHSILTTTAHNFDDAINGKDYQEVKQHLSAAFLKQKIRTLITITGSQYFKIVTCFAFGSERSTA